MLDGIGGQLGMQGGAEFVLLGGRRFSGLLLFAIGLGAMGLNVAQIGSWMNYGVDFTGGTLVQVEFTRRGYERATHTALCPKDAMLKLTATLRKLPGKPSKEPHKEPRKK